MTVTPEMDFHDEGRLPTDQKIVLLEGLSLPRASSLCKYVSRCNRNVHVPYLKQLEVDKRIRAALTERFSVRDGIAEMLGSMSSRKACLAQVQQSRHSRQESLSLMRLHLLSTYSFVRDASISVQRWLDLVTVSFGDRIPGAIVFLDHRHMNGNVDLSALYQSIPSRLQDGTIRDQEKVLRIASEEADRRAEALEALQSRYDIRTLIVPSGLGCREDYRRVLSFMRTL